MPKEDTSKIDVNDLSERIKKMRTEFIEEYDYDPSLFY
jgi:hypothetical protein